MTELRCIGVSAVRRGRTVLTDVSLEFSAGRAVALVGPNGVGKTTSLELALGLLTPTHGRVELDGRPVGRWSPRERAARVAWLPQAAHATEPLPAWEWVAAARYRFGESLAAARNAAERALHQVGVGDLTARPVTRLSGGERQRVALAALFAQEADVLLADEPASHLDPALQLETYARLGAAVRAGQGLGVVTHDVNLLGALDCPVDVVGLRHGRVRFTCGYDDPDLSQHLSHLFDVPIARVEASFEAGPRSVLVVGPRPHP